MITIYRKTTRTKEQLAQELSDIITAKLDERKEKDGAVSNRFRINIKITNS